MKILKSEQRLRTSDLFIPPTSEQNLGGGGKFLYIVQFLRPSKYF